MSYFFINNKLIFVIDPIVLKQIFVRHSSAISKLSLRYRIWPIVLTDTIDYRTIGFLHCRPNHRKYILIARIRQFS